MKMILCKDYVESYQIERVKADMKEFKARYTEGDLIRFFRDTVEYYDGYNAEVIKAEIEAMDSGYALGNKTTFWCHMILNNCLNMYRFDFWMDMDGTIDTRTLAGNRKMYKIQKFELCEEIK